MSQFFTSRGQNIRALAMNIQDWFPLGLTGLIVNQLSINKIYGF